MRTARKLLEDVLRGIGEFAHAERAFLILKVKFETQFRRRRIAYLPGTCVEYAGKMWPERTEVQKIPREEDLDPSRVYAFRKIVQELLIPAGVVDMAALASRGGGPRFLHAMWTLYEHC